MIGSGLAEREALVSTGWPLFSFPAQTGVENACKGFNSGTVSSFQSGRVLSGQKSLIIGHPPMSECSQGCDLVKNMRKKLWLKFPGLTPSRIKSKYSSEQSRQPIYIHPS